ncbi:hypothetical protein Mapa_017806 [Marchantia paleacea]|nr:hypothetical protein Mapa_017806 [Marchantia paleacea]
MFTVPLIAFFKSKSFYYSLEARNKRCEVVLWLEKKWRNHYAMIRWRRMLQNSMAKVKRRLRK